MCDRQPRGDGVFAIKRFEWLTLSETVKMSMWAVSLVGQVRNVIVVSPAQIEIIQAAKQLYDTSLRPELEPAHDGEFIAIEPVSGEYFLGKTLSAAIQSARRSHPTRLPFAMRVGSDPAIHLGHGDDFRAH